MCAEVYSIPSWGWGWTVTIWVWQETSGQWQTPPWQAVCNCKCSWPHVAQRARTFVVLLLITKRDRVILPISPAKLLPVMGKENSPLFPSWKHCVWSCTCPKPCCTITESSCDWILLVLLALGCKRWPHPGFLWRAGSKLPGFLARWISVYLETNTLKAWDSLDRGHRIKSEWISGGFRSARETWVITIKKAGTGRGWAMGGWHCGTAPVDDDLRTYFWPQMKVLVSAKDTENVPKICCYS